MLSRLYLRKMTRHNHTLSLRLKNTLSPPALRWAFIRLALSPRVPFQRTGILRVCQEKGRGGALHPELFGQALGRGPGDEAGDVSAQGGDLAHEGGGDKLPPRGGGQEEGLYARVQAGVHPRHLELILKIRHGTQAPDDARGPDLPRVADEEAREAGDLNGAAHVLHQRDVCPDPVSYTHL